MKQSILKTYIDQYKEIKAEIADLEHRIKKHKANIITQDVVSASAGAPSFAKTSVTIIGVDVKLDKKIKTYQRLLINAQTRLTDVLIRLETEIQQIDDSFIRMLIRLKYIDNLTWEQIALKIGGGNRAESLKKRMIRYFKNE